MTGQGDGQDGGAAPFDVLDRLTDGNDERGQDNHSQQRARLARGQRRGDPAADSVRQAPAIREPGDEQRPSDATRDDVTDFAAEQTGEDVVAEHVGGQPGTLLLTLYRRRSPWRGALTGRLVGWGRRPRQALRPPRPVRPPARRP